MSNDDKKYLVSFDTDRIKDYIFATNNLREIRGASAILLEVEEKRKNNRFSSGIDVVFAAGGGGAVLIDDEKESENLAQDIERNFRNQTVSGSITCVTVSPQEIADDGERFKGMMDAAMQKMQLRKAAKAELSTMPLAPYMSPCATCGILAAETRHKVSGDLLCLSCLNKREKGQTQRNEGYTKAFHSHVNDMKDINVHSKEAWRAAGLSEDLSELSQLDGTGYIGFIMMDGNNMGEQLKKIDKKERFRDYSTTLKKTVEGLVFDALAKNGNHPIDKRLPFEVVLIGGDDVMIFTTAKLAMPFTLDVLEGFEKSSERIYDAGEVEHKEGEKLTMSAGVVYAHGHFPIPALVEIGETLLRNAKKKAAESEYKNSAIDFQVVSGSMMDLETVQKDARYMRPFMRNEMEKLCDYARHLDIPRSQLHRVYESCVTGRLVDGTMATLHLLGRLRNPVQRQRLKDIIKDFSELGDSEKFVYWPWTRLSKNGKEQRASILVDMIDLHRFVKGEHQ